MLIKLFKHALCYIIHSCCAIPSCKLCLEENNNIAHYVYVEYSRFSPRSLRNDSFFGGNANVLPRYYRKDREIERKTQIKKIKDDIGFVLYVCAFLRNRKCTRRALEPFSPSKKDEKIRKCFQFCFSLLFVFLLLLLSPFIWFSIKILFSNFAFFFPVTKRIFLSLALEVFKYESAI